MEDLGCCHIAKQVLHGFVGVMVMRCRCGRVVELDGVYWHRRSGPATSDEIESLANRKENNGNHPQSDTRWEIGHDRSKDSVRLSAVQVGRQQNK